MRYYIVTINSKQFSRSHYGLLGEECYSHYQKGIEDYSNIYRNEKGTSFGKGHFRASVGQKPTRLPLCFWSFSGEKIFSLGPDSHISLY